MTILSEPGCDMLLNQSSFPKMANWWITDMLLPRGSGQPVEPWSATLSTKQRASMLEAYGSTRGDPGPDASHPLITVTHAGSEVWTVQANASSTQPGKRP